MGCSNVRPLDRRSASPGGPVVARGIQFPQQTPRLCLSFLRLPGSETRYEQPFLDVLGQGPLGVLTGA